MFGKNALLISVISLFMMLVGPAQAVTPVKGTGKSAAALSNDGAASEAKLLCEIVALSRDAKYEQALTLLDSSHLGHSSVKLSIARTYLLEKTKPLVYPLAEARLAVRLGPHNCQALTNLGLLLQRNGERGAAIEKYRAATQIDAAAWEAHLGLAQCLAVDGVDGRQIADRELKAAFITADDSAEKWSLMGSTFIVLQEYARAQDCFSRALKAKPGDYFLRCGLAKACLLNGERQEASELFAEVITPALVDPQLALLYASSKVVSADDLLKILQIGEHNFVGDHLFFYRFGREVEAHGYLDLAQQAYLDAAKSTVAPAVYALALIGNRSAAGQDAQAQTIFEKYCPAGALAAAKNNRDPFALPLASIGGLFKAPSDSALKIVHVVFRNIKCGCRRPVIELKLRSHPGVIFAALQDEKDPPACFIYDAKVSNAAAILDKTKRDEDKVDVISEEPVKSVFELVQLIQKATDQPDKHLFSIWSFQPSPMELPR